MSAEKSTVVSGEWSINKSTLLTVLICFGILLLALFAWNKWGKGSMQPKIITDPAAAAKTNVTNGGTSTDTATATPKV